MVNAGNGMKLHSISILHSLHLATNRPMGTSWNQSWICPDLLWSTEWWTIQV